VVLQLSEVPILQAPMAGGPSTPELVAAVAAAGGFGFLAAGYLTATQLQELIDRTRALTDAPFGVNLFMPSAPGDAAEIARYADTLSLEVGRLGVELGAPVWEDDAIDAKLDVVEAARPHLVSLTFGCPDSSVVDRLHTAGCLVAVTVTSWEEARLAEASGADLLAVQGTEAGGHQGGFLIRAANQQPLVSLLQQIVDVTHLPLVGTGGVMTGADLAAVLGAGAVAAQLGTAFLCATEAGTSPTYRAALLDQRYGDTIVTRAFSGRFARGLANEFALAHHEEAPEGYPEIHHLTRPLRAAATKAGDASVVNLWAGTGWRHVTSEPAGSIVRRIAGEAQRPT
jgi:nitronate monooxygenase